MAKQKYNIRSQNVLIYDFYLPTNLDYDKILVDTLNQFFDSKELAKNEIISGIAEVNGLGQKGKDKFLKIFICIN